MHDFTYRFFFENDKTIEMENKISGFQRLSRAWRKEVGNMRDPCGDENGLYLDCITVNIPVTIS